MKKTTAYHQMYTPEGEELTAQLHRDPDCIPWNEYPRPLLRRNSFFCLNGPWTFRASPDAAEETILVPFPPESMLSGICRHMGREPSLYYRKTFTLPSGFVRDRTILHFGATDQIARVILNGMELGEHRGGYDSFSFEITDILRDENTLEVYVTDRLQDRILPYGKQREDRGGMWYTPVSGIWQTVWIESVPVGYVQSLECKTTLDIAHITAAGVQNGVITVSTPEGELSVPLENGRAEIRLTSPRHWTPEDPYLYHFTLQTENDRVQSYFPLRTIDVRTYNDIPRICLNGKPYFFHGLLDQGYWPDGIFTPASPESYTKDILAMKSLGFNMLRKHIKVEPERFYADCDRLGMIVFQDMVNNSGYSFLRDTALPTVGLKTWPDKWLHRNPASRKAFAENMEKTVRQLHNHPCICCWTIFNEGWGQFDSGAMYQKLHELDDTRIIDSTSGWFRGPVSDVESLHIYFKPVKIKKADLPVILSEFGGYSCRIADHAFNPDKTYGYRFFEKQPEWENALLKLYEDEIIPAVKEGLCGAVYTQVSDVEDETNGLLTYDRKICKADPAKMTVIARKLTGAMRSCAAEKPQA